MSLFHKPKLSEPNEMGFQFGIAEDLTKYAHERQEQWGNSHLPSLDITVLEVWKDDRLNAYLFIDEKTNQPVKEVTHGYEAAACALDAFKAAKLADEIEAREKKGKEEEK